MDKVEFCIKYCPMPFRGKFRNGEDEVDCDCEENDCPFKDVDFIKVLPYDECPKPRCYGVYDVDTTTYTSCNNIPASSWGDYLQLNWGAASSTVWDDRTDKRGVMPTDEEIKEFWEWCGLTHEEPNSKGQVRWYLGSGCNYIGWYFGSPTIDLNNLFKYAVPKLNNQMRLSWNVWNKWIAEIRSGTEGKWYSSCSDDPTVALFKAIQQVIKGE